MKKALSLTVLVALLATAAISSAGAAAAGKTETLRMFAKDVSIRVTHADGTVVRKAPFPEPQPGDTLDVNALDYVGNHRHHAKRWSASHHLRCVFADSGAPDCESQVAIGGSLLIFRGFPGTLIDGTGRYQGASGRVISNKEVNGGSDIVARVQLR
jgi:hypothetical protein